MVRYSKGKINDKMLLIAQELGLSETAFIKKLTIHTDDKLKKNTKMINKENSKTYKWGDNCDSWVFVDNDNLSVKMESMPISTKEKLHFHSKAQQFFFILSGTATFYVADKIKSISENNGILINPKTEHYIANESNTILDFLVISQPTTNSDRTTIEK